MDRLDVEYKKILVPLDGSEVAASVLPFVAITLIRWADGPKSVITRI